ncbi:AAA family ATPase [Arthrobacter zhangbolii]|uniref:AAA family ATPase n=1 Tax=Arthrobacter zhangbolii TaxID=2886936 RepID=A0A9X1M7E3_9MICC|nr:AAA family ATPase [Arthrobacter zhangbolii]MCC3272252.1 AAA family ATPase [Arthrobacter zhangbolii]UON93734.1 AAA family ATPase [Arthrobacter zhangbolii]
MWKLKLVRLEIRSFRSFVGAFDVPLVSGMNSFVGPNNCGKSNLVRALKLALDPSYEFNPDNDVPGQLRYAYPHIMLTFKIKPRTSPEKTLIRYLTEYEESVVGLGKPTYAANGEIRLVVKYRGSRTTGLIRQEYFAAKGVGGRRGDPKLNEQALKKFRQLVRFVSVESGQSIEALLVGQFREILHSVLREELGTAYSDSEKARTVYEEHLQQSLLAPMRDKILQLSKRLFPEVTEVGLIPAVTSLEDTLSNIGIRLTDSVETDLASKGTGVAGGVLIALLRYLSDASKQSIIFALEEPEAFLHPAAQHSLRDDLEGLAERDDVTLLVTSHSPYIVSRSPAAQVVALEKTVKDGVSKLVGTAQGNEEHASLLSGLFVDSVIPELLDRYASVPSRSRVILVVEGETDKQFIELAIKALGRSKDLAGLTIIPCKGAYSVAAQSVLLRAEATQEIVALFDSDEEGRAGRNLMTGRFGFDKRSVLEYLTYVGQQDAESEWMFPAALMQHFVEQQGEEIVLKSKAKHGGEYRYDFTPRGKYEFPLWLESHAKATDYGRWEPLLDDLVSRVQNTSTGPLAGQSRQPRTETSHQVSRTQRRRTANKTKGGSPTVA